MSTDAGHWRRCNVCKKGIPFGSIYYVCSVSTCNRKSKPLQFCSVDCWDAHLPLARHRSATAVEERAPLRPDSAADAPGSVSGGAPRRLVTREPLPPSPPAAEVLVIASRLKEYVRARSGMNTSDGVLGPLSEHLRWLVEQAIRNAAREGRKTLLDRDIPPVITPHGGR